MVRTRRPVAIAVAIVVALASGACAGGPSLPAGSPQASQLASSTPPPTPSLPAVPTRTPGVPLGEIEAIVAAMRTVRSASMEYSVTYEGFSTVLDGMGLSGTGLFVLDDAMRAQIALDMSDFELGTIEVVLEGDIVFLRGGSFAALDPAGRWIRVDLTSDHPNAALFAGSIGQQTDPWSSLYILFGATAAPTELERTTIDGDEVRHLRLRVDMDLAVERATERARDYLLVEVANLRQQGVARIFGAEVWIDAAGRVRRATYRFELNRLSDRGTMVATYSMRDFDAPLEIEIPPPGEVVDVEELDLP